MLPQRPGMCSQLASVGFHPILNDGQIPSTIQNSEREKRMKYGRWEKMGRYIYGDPGCVQNFWQRKGGRWNRAWKVLSCETQM